ncbi:MAG TPA: hypothetical protein VFI11_00795 [Anaerolineales bacterium]|nr:hypothetical protein [Anaerolineales bacterium]
MTNAQLLELGGTALAALLTIMVLSYALGDNAFFRLASYLFIGVAAGYAGAVAWHDVLQPRLIDPVLTAGPAILTNSQQLTGVVAPVLLVLLLLSKVAPTMARLGGLPVALMVGVGAGVVVGGAITGTLIPQTVAAMDSLNPAVVAPQTGETGIERLLNVLIVLIGTISTLAYFRFTGRREGADTGRYAIRRFRTPIGAIPIPWPILPFIGEMFISLTFGVMFAGALAAVMVVLIERLQFLAGAVGLLLGSLVGAP